MSAQHHDSEGRRPPARSRTDGRSGAGRGTSRSRGWLAGGIALGLTGAALAGMPAQALNSNPPTGPGTIEIFPKRDMVAIEGYGEFAGRTADIKVIRDGTLIGNARGTVDGTGFLEVNHPGGVCWGAGTSLAVTPDIRGGDVVEVDFLGTPAPEGQTRANQWDGATTSDIDITDVTRVDAGNRLVITGSYGPGVDMPNPADLAGDPGKAEVEIVNPDMRGGTSAVGERAIGWPVEPDPTEPAPTGYTVTGTVDPLVTLPDGSRRGTFTVTFAFDQASDLDLAEAGEVVALGWESAAPPELGIEAFYDMTLYEFHEASGPGMGGCPAGPQELRPSAPVDATAKGTAEGWIDVTWGPGTAMPAAPPITGYEVTAIRPYLEGGEAGGVVRVGPNERRATVKGLTPDEIYTVEVTTRSDAGDSLPTVMQVRTSAHVAASAVASTSAPLNADGVTYSRPLVTDEDGDFGVYLDPAPGALAGTRIHYTTDGSEPSQSSPRAEVGEPIDIRTDTTLRWIVVDGGNNPGQPGQQLFDIELADAPATPPAPSAEAGDASATVSFPLVDGGEAYRVQPYRGTVKHGAVLDVPLPTDPAATTASRVVTGLTNGTAYSFTVAVRRGTAWSDESPNSTPVTPTAAPKAVANPDETVLRGRTFTLDGSASVGATTYRWEQLRPEAADNGGLPQDPAVDLDPEAAGVQTTSALPTLRVPFPLLTTPRSDHTLRYRLTTTHPGGLESSDEVQITGRPDTVTVDEARWRQGRAIRLNGTGSQEGATLRFHDASANGRELFSATVVNGVWTAPAVTVTLSTGQIYVWSDHGYTGTITTRR